jgi:hypothetical protein
MTIACALAISRHGSPESCKILSPKENGGRRKCRALDAPAASYAAKKSTRVVTTGPPKTSGISCAMVLTVSFVLSAVIGLSCHRSRRDAKHHRHLTPASRRPDHTTSPSAPHRSSGRALASTASRPACRDDREPPLLKERDAGHRQVIWHERKARNFSARDWTGFG